MTASSSAGQQERLPVEGVLQVYAAERGLRRRAEALSRAGEEWLPELVVVDGPWFWVRTGDQVHTNGVDPDHEHGGTDFVLLLRPAEVPDGFDLTATGATETVAGRPCDVVVATLRDSDPVMETPESEVFGMISGGQDFRLHLDQQTSTLLRVTKLVDGEAAEVAEFLDIAFDEPVVEDLFRPPS